MVPYNVALIAVKSLLNVAISQYEYVEQIFESLEEQEILQRASQKLQKEPLKGS